MEQNIFDAIMWWAVGLAVSTIVIFLAVGWLKGYMREKESLQQKKHNAHRYSH
jgi:putative effector of murein hydrolase LrgA (UPF0299 family)